MTKQSVKKTTAQEATTAKKTTAATKAPAAEKAVAAKKNAAVKKTTAARKTLKTSIVAFVDVGFGNTLYIRGEGAGLSWEKGVSMKNSSAAEWTFDTTKANGTVVFKFLINDQVWAEGDDLTIKAGSKSVSSPVFVW